MNTNSDAKALPRKRLLVGLLAVPAFAIGAFGGSAAAASGVSLDPDTGSASGFLTDVTIEDTVIGATYRVGLCSDAVFGAFQAPACVYLADDVEGDGDDIVLEDVFVEAEFDNAHFGVLPGQPADYDCTSDGDCSVLVVEHDGLYPSVSAPVTFT